MSNDLNKEKKENIKNVQKNNLQFQDSLNSQSRQIIKNSTYNFFSQLQQIIEEANINSASQLHDMIKNAKINSASRLQQNIDVTKIHSASQLHDMTKDANANSASRSRQNIDITKIHSAAQLHNMTKDANANSAYRSQQNIDITKIHSASQLHGMTKDANANSAYRSQQNIDITKIHSASQLHDMIKDANINSAFRLQQIIKDTNNNFVPQLEQIIRDINFNSQLKQFNKLNNTYIYSFNTDISIYNFNKSTISDILNINDMLNKYYDNYNLFYINNIHAIKDWKNFIQNDSNKQNNILTTEETEKRTALLGNLIFQITYLLDSLVDIAGTNNKRSAFWNLVSFLSFWYISIYPKISPQENLAQLIFQQDPPAIIFESTEEKSYQIPIKIEDDETPLQPGEILHDGISEG